MCVVAAAVALSVRPALGQSTAFTYQGRLADAGVPADGLHDFRFRLFDAAEGGRQVGEMLCADDVDVADGLFTVILDFDQQFATPEERHLEVEVRRDTGLNCSNPAGFVILTPRQQLTAAPLASHAKSAFALAAADGSPESAVLVDDAGNVGIGTLPPGHRLDVGAGFLGDGIALRGAGSNDPGYHLYEGSISRASLGLALHTGIWSTDAVPGDIVLRSSTGKLLLQNGALGSALAITGNKVGIGTIAPASRLHVRSTEPGADAIRAEASEVGDGVFCTGFRGVTAIGTHTGVVGEGFNSGVFGSPSTNISGAGVFGAAFSADTNGVLGLNTDPNGVAVRCNGKFTATGTKSFCIDHPLDPENKLLYHYCTEGPEPINAYSGNIRTDAAGIAVVTLPAYFEEINRDFRYQLTVVDDGDGFVFAKVARRVQDNSFEIRTSAADVLVSWRVEGVRNDRYVRSAATPVEAYKTESERGRYLRPDLYGAGPERAINRSLPALGAGQK